MSSYGRDAIWDLDTWAEIDAAVADEVRRVSVVHQLFGVEKMGTADEAAIAVPDGEVVRAAVLSVPESEVAPYAELSVSFDLTPARSRGRDRPPSGSRAGAAGCKEARSRD